MLKFILSAFLAISYTGMVGGVFHTIYSLDWKRRK